jgi:hypothetical protein
LHFEVHDCVRNFPARETLYALAEHRVVSCSICPVLSISIVKPNRGSNLTSRTKVSDECKYCIVWSVKQHITAWKSYVRYFGICHAIVRRDLFPHLEPWEQAGATLPDTHQNLLLYAGLAWLCLYTWPDNRDITSSNIECLHAHVIMSRTNGYSSKCKGTRNDGLKFCLALRRITPIHDLHLYSRNVAACLSGAPLHSRTCYPDSLPYCVVQSTTISPTLHVILNTRLFFFYG